MSINDLQQTMLNRVLIRLYEDVANINTQIHQVQSDVNYLVQSGQITEEDASFILQRIPMTTDPASAVTQALQNASISDSPPPPDNYYAAANSTPTNATSKFNGTTSVALQPRRPVPQPPVVNTFQARALWDYNTDNEHPDDLAFYTGDIIDVEESSTEKNEDWWTGKVRGQSGLFPSNYVERILHSLPPPPPAPMISKSSRPGSEVGVTPTYVPYRSTHAAMNSYPVGGGPNALGLQPSQPPQQSGSEEPKRAGKYDHLKGTMANSAASGVGFGAGAALAGGLVRAIF